MLKYLVTQRSFARSFNQLFGRHKLDATELSEVRSEACDWMRTHTAAVLVAEQVPRRTARGGSVAALHARQTRARCAVALSAALALSAAVGAKRTC